MSIANRILVYGGKGTLGAVLVSAFRKQNHWVCSIDLKRNDEADANIVVSEVDDWEKQNSEVHMKVEEVLNGDKVNGIFCVADGWEGSNASMEHLAKNSNRMWKESIWPSTISASIAAKHLSTGGVLTLPGALSALKGTPGMMEYGMAKAAIHQLTKSLGKSDSGLPEGACALCVLPVTLDSPMKMEWMANVDLFSDWLVNKDRPASGSLVKLATTNSITTAVIVDH